MPRQNYRVKLVRGGEEFEAEGDKAFVLAMFQRLQAAVDGVLTDSPLNEDL